MVPVCVIYEQGKSRLLTENDALTPVRIILVSHPHGNDGIFSKVAFIA